MGSAGVARLSGAAVRVSVDKCSGEGCICKSLRRKPIIDIKVAERVWPLLGFPPPAAGGAAMRMAMAREMDLVRMQRMQP